MKILGALGACLLLSSGAFANDYKYAELNTYKAAVDVLLQQIPVTKTSADVQTLATGTENLVQLGVAVMNLYGVKNPNCAEQFKAFEVAIPGMETLTIDEVMTKYHDAKALPAAPRHCFYSRAEIVHPVLNLIRMKGTWSQEVSVQISDDLQEVIEHLDNIQMNLDNPPN